MTETLLLRMPDADKPASWLAMDAFGNRMGQARSGTLAEAVPFATGRRLRVGVPGSAVTLLHANIPTHNAQKLLQAVPFALEDKLAEDVETLHFAMGTRDAHGYLVAVLARARMRLWLDDLATAGLKPAEMIPDMLELPVREHTLILVSDDDGQLLARFPDGMAVAADAALMPLLIRRHLAALPETQRCTHALIHAATDTESQTVSELLAGLSLEIAHRPLNGGAITLMAASGQNTQTINLLQGEFSLHGGVSEHWRRWRTAVALLVALCAVLIVQQGVSEFSLRHEATKMDSQIAVLFHAAVPDMKNINDIGTMQKVMQQRLNQLTGDGANTTGLLPMLTAVGAALQSQNGLQLQGFSYHGGSLQLQVQAASIDALNSMKSALAQNAGFQVNLDSVNSKAGQTTGRLTLSGSGG
ncbi:MAG: type II secretion system protein GspL [Gammaproteobacteria bacterium]